MHAFLSSADVFKINVFKKILSGTLSECQKFWIQIRTNILGPNCLQRLSADDTSRQRVMKELRTVFVIFMSYLMVNTIVKKSCVLDIY